MAGKASRSGLRSMAARPRSAKVQNKPACLRSVPLPVRIPGCTERRLGLVEAIETIFPQLSRRVSAQMTCPWSHAMTFLANFLRNETGATAIEYGLIAAGISVAIVTVVSGRLVQT